MPETHPAMKLVFQSTLSVRRATGLVQEHGRHVRISIHALRKESDIIDTSSPTAEKISIHALRKESDKQIIDKANQILISIHALRKESDRNAHVNTTGDSTFQSTLSVRRATLRSAKARRMFVISIHALRKESDNPIPLILIN